MIVKESYAHEKQIMITTKLILEWIQVTVHVKNWLIKTQVMTWSNTANKDV